MGRCLECGNQTKQFKNGKYQKYCSAECCAQYMNHRKTGLTREQWRDEFNKKHERICSYCGKVYLNRRGENEGNKYCSRECYFEAIKQRKINKDNHKDIAKVNNKKRICKECGKEYVARSGVYCSDECRKAVANRKSLERSIGKKDGRYKCKVCGKPFITAYGDKRRSYCSTFCKDIAKRDARQVCKQTRRARKRKAFVATVYRSDIFERDSWRCQICGKKVNRSVKVPHPMAPTIDHIIPLAVGGTHEPRNVQCAHFICNSRKSHTGIGDQLRLM